MWRIKFNKPIALRQLKILKIESRNHRASHQRKRPTIFYLRSKPASCLHHCLQDFARLRIASELNLRISTICLDHMYRYSRSKVEMPNFIGSQPVKSGKVLPLEQEIDCRRGRPRTRKLPRQSLQNQIGPVGLAVIAAFGMRLQSELTNPISRIFNHSLSIISYRSSNRSREFQITW